MSQDKHPERGFMQSLVQLLLRVLEESGTLNSIDTSQDRKTILARYRTEGEAFLTITLASMTSDLYKALDQEKVTDDLFPSFKRRKGEKLPVFLGGFFRSVFDPVTGGLLDTSRQSKLAADVVRSMVQITGLLGKLFEQCSESRTLKALERYVENDAKVGYDNHFRRERLESLGLNEKSIRVGMHTLFGSSNSFANHMIRSGNLRPKHGPGSVADSLFGNEKWRQDPWPEELEAVFPFGEWAFNSWLNYLDEVDAGQVADPGEIMPVKVITVPKTQKTPRIIAIEPTAYQYMQQGVRGVLEKSYEIDHFAHTMMGYESQLPNQEMARKGSIDGTLATLDLSDASDLVSCELVDIAFTDWPALRQAILGTRSRLARVPVREDLLSLNKFASMGSALCFPVEAMMFSVMVLLGCRRVLNPRGTLGETKVLLEGKVRVYGDDIIVPVDCAQSVAAVLEAYGLRVNYAKSFWNGNFRESCGKEYWYGFDITYAKVRYRFPSLQKALSRDVESSVHTIAFRNNLREKSYFDTVEWIDNLLEKRLQGVFPIVGVDSPALGRHNDGQYQTDRYDSHLQKPLVKAYVVNVKSPKSNLEGYGALMKCLVKDSDLPNPDPEHLLRAGRPSALRLKLKYVSAC
ncbi:TPA_asm: RNA-directed RNA polymerase [ssRNA phage Esthiorhiza.1_3]|uniref:RNA-directed RNA polymerase n=2 Tax=Leviviricetes TaxID=2842243 RepID=A0A8S5KXZ6_9VIRU|nr:RNA-directed RNA polymerase [ssRNA phage Esthiorhiza.1_3]DAD50144.1 TPA_asm: RNA-directed RNA polymerase [ssRNA phage Esthiorhiza.1_3]